jgi:hypothetical protein
MWSCSETSCLREGAFMDWTLLLMIVAIVPVILTIALAWVDG